MCRISQKLLWAVGFASLCLVGAACSDSEDPRHTRDAAPLDGTVDAGPLADTSPADSANATDQTDDGRSCTVRRLDTLETQTVESLGLDGLQVTASAKLHLLENNGLGVVDHLVDGGEWVMFSLSTPQLGVSYELSGAGGPSGKVGATTVEAFDASGASLGTQTALGMRTHDVSELFGRVRLSAFKLQPEAKASIRVRAVAWHCCKRQVDFAAMQNQTAAQLDLEAVDVSGSADLTLKQGQGLGVVGDRDDLLDGAEGIRFTLAQPGIRVVFNVTTTTTEYVDVDIEAFDLSGESLGASSSTVEAQDEITIRDARYDPITEFEVRASDDETGHAIGALQYWGDCR